MTVELKEWNILDHFEAYRKIYLQYLREENDVDLLAYAQSEEYAFHVSDALTRKVNPCKIFQIKWDKRMAGFMTIRTEPDQVYLADFYVLPEYRNRGIGTNALRSLQTTAQKIYLTPSLRAISLYLREGFIPADQIYEDNQKQIYAWQRK